MHETRNISPPNITSVNLKCWRISLGYNLLQTGHFLCKKHIEKTAYSRKLTVAGLLVTTFSTTQLHTFW